MCTDHNSKKNLLLLRIEICDQYMEIMFISKTEAPKGMSVALIIQQNVSPQSNSN